MSAWTQKQSWPPAQAGQRQSAFSFTFGLRTRKQRHYTEDYSKLKESRNFFCEPCIRLNRLDALRGTLTHEIIKY